MASEEILRLIPHRPPFLWVDRIVALEAARIETEKVIPADLELFQGHYPDYPILPGVLLCEAVFQSGAILISSQLQASGKTISGVPVLTRILGAKFKREVKPGDTIRMTAQLVETVGPAWFMKGKVLLAGQTAVSVEFSCMVK